MRKRLFVTFMLIFLVPFFAMAFIIDLWATKNITKNAENSYQKVMENVARRFEEDMGLLAKTTSLIASDSLINRIANMSGQQVDYGQINLSTLQDYKSQLYFHCVNSRLYSEAAICVPGKNFVLSTRGIWQLNWYFGSEFFAKPLGDDPAFQFLYEANVFHQTTVSRFNAEKQGSIYILPGIKSPSGKTVMTMLFFIEQGVLNGYLEELMLFPGSSIVLMDEKQNIIASTGEQDLIDLILTQKEESQSEREGYRIMDYTTVAPQLTIEAFLPEASLFSEATAFRTALMAILAAACVVATFLSVELSHINYKPFAHLLKLLNIPTSNFLSSWALQVEKAESNLSLLLHEKNQMAARHEENLPMVRYGALTHLLEGNGDAIDTAALNMMDLPLSLPFFAVGVGQKTRPELPVLEPVKKTFLQQVTVYSMVYREQDVFVFNFQNQGDFENQLKIFFKEYPGVTLSESSFTDLEDIHTAYQQALFAKVHYPLKQEALIYPYSEALAASKMALPYSSQMEKQLQGYIKEGSAQKAYEMLRNHVEKNAPFVSAASVSKLLAAVEISLGKILPDSQGLMAAINQLPPPGDDLRDQLHYLYSLFDTAAQQVLFADTQAEKDKNQKIVAFIEENLNNPQLSLAMVAEAFEMSTTYLSRYFKDQFHIGYLDYVNTKRIERAKVLLNNKALSIKTIAAETGFASDATFRRVFKKYEGKPPRAD